MANTPVVFIHGLWVHATSWRPWIDFFGQAGYDPIAPPWPGSADTVDEARAHPEKAVAGEHDHTVPPAITRGTLKLYHRSLAVTELKEIPNHGHSLTIDKGWREGATVALDWLKGKRTEFDLAGIPKGPALDEDTP